MTRVRYLAGLAGATGRRPAPLLRPPRRLFPHEPLPVEALPLSPPVAEPAGNPRTPGEPAIQSEPAPRTHEPRAESEPAVVVPEPARGPDRSSAPAAPPRETVRAARAQTPPPLVRRPERTAEPRPASRDPEPVRSAAARRSVTRFEPSRLRPPVAAPSERTPAAASRPEGAAVQATGLHIGSIEVTVAPPPEAPREPAPAAPPAPVHRAPEPFDHRGASTSRWFGLAQR